MDKMNKDFLDLVSFVDDMVEDIVVEERRFAVDTFMKAVTRPTNNLLGETGKTPVLSGKLMANTVLSVGRIDNKSYEIEDEHGDDTYLKAMLKLGTAPAYSKIHIQNNAKDTDTKKNYSTLADYLGWANTPAYQFFTLSEHKMYNEVEKRK